MSNKSHDFVTAAINEDTLRRAMWARLDAALQSGKVIIEEHRTRMAEALLMHGICLIPSPHLQDHQFVVSQGVYDAAVELAQPKKEKV